MSIIKNYKDLCLNNERKVVLDLINRAFESIQPKIVIGENISIGEDSILYINKEPINLSLYKNIYLIGFGKGSSLISKLIEEKLGRFLKGGYVIDIMEEKFEKIKFVKGTHPLPSKENFQFANKILTEYSNLSEDDLVITVICGGGSSLFEVPYALSLREKTKIDDQILKSGMDIYQMNTIRKHLSKVKGGFLAKALYPAKIVNLIFSDVLGNDISFIASGPTTIDETTMTDAIAIKDKYKINIDNKYFTETPKDLKYFNNVFNFLILTNNTPIKAIERKANDMGIETFVYSKTISEDAKTLGQKLIQNTKPNTILIAGGESFVNVKGKGMGGRNQEVVLGALLNIDHNIVITSFGTDGWDNYKLAGAIGDITTVKKAKELNLNMKEYLMDDNTLPFFEKTKDGIYTGKLASNVSDIMMVYKK